MPTQNLGDVTLLGKRLFTEVILLSILIGDHPGLPGWTPNPMTNVLRQREAMLRWRQRQEWSHAATVKEHVEPPEAERRILPENLSREHGPATFTLTSDFWPPDCKDIQFCLLNHLICGKLLQ